MIEEVKAAPKKKQPKIKPAGWALRLRNRVTSVLVGLGYLATPAFAKRMAIRTAWIIFTLVLIRDFLLFMVHTFWPSVLSGSELFILDKVFGFLTGGS